MKTKRIGPSASAIAAPRPEPMNSELSTRLAGIHASLMATYQAGIRSSDASKGIEREIFINRFLAVVLPQVFRFGSGEIIDTFQKVSGQIDIVIENPFFPSLPIIEGGPRLYLAEGVAAAIEVKSDIRKQWPQVASTAARLKALFPCPGGVDVRSSLAMADCRIPLFAIGFRGWARVKPVKEFIDAGLVDAVLVLESGLFCAHSKFKVDNISSDRVNALWTFLGCLHDHVTAIGAISTTPLIYGGSAHKTVTRL